MSLKSELCEGNEHKHQSIIPGAPIIITASILKTNTSLGVLSSSLLSFIFSLQSVNFSRPQFWFSFRITTCRFLSWIEPKKCSVFIYLLSLYTSKSPNNQPGSNHNSDLRDSREYIQNHVWGTRSRRFHLVTTSLTKVISIVCYDSTIWKQFVFTHMSVKSEVWATAQSPPW